jgi:AcrR family transcriptional regulator
MNRVAEATSAHRYHVKDRRRRAGKDTPETILRAAVRVLARDGFPALTARNIATEAGTNLALLNYHFGSKERFLLALFDVLDNERIARQRAMYAVPADRLSTKWRLAVEFYRSDLAAGYVRVLQELTAYGYSNARVRRRVRDRMREWRGLVEQVAASELPPLGIDVSPSVVASLVASFWLGMEIQHLLGVTEDEGRFFEILDSIGDWIDARERAVGGSRHARSGAR